MKEPKRLLSHGATDFERQLLRAVASERPSALLRSRMQRSLGLVGPLAWASNVKAMFGGVGTKVTLGVAVAGVVVAGGVAGYQMFPVPESDDTVRNWSPAPMEVAPEVPSPAAVQLQNAESERAEAARQRAATAPGALPAVENRAAGSPIAESPAPTNAPAALGDSEDGRLREEIALLDGVKSALQRGEREQARRSLDTYRERFPDGILRREANVLRRRTETKTGRGSDGTRYED